MYKQRVQHVLGMANDMTSDFNCWGATMFIANAKPTLGWVENREMGEWLIANYTPIKEKEAREGDILALFSPDIDLVHTAYALGDNQFVHKLGRNVARIGTLNEILKDYRNQASKYIFLRSNLCV